MVNALNLMGEVPLAASQTVSSGANIAPLELVWRNSNSHQLAWQRLGNTQRVTAASDIVDPSWKIIGTGDVNGDQRLDILWRHDSGLVAWWIMGDNNQLQETASLPSVADLNWQVVGTGDANGDGNLDILWRHAASGTNLWWLMSSYQPRSGNHTAIGNQLVPSVTDPNWQVGGVADLNKDRISDLFWYHRPSGIGQWWVMNANGQAQSAVLLNETIPVGQTVRGIADYNGDSQLDLFLQDNWGNASVWLMRSPNVTNRIDVLDRTSFSLGLPGSGWQLFGITNIPNRAASAMQPDAGNSWATASLQPTALFTVGQSIGGNDPLDYYLFGTGQRGIFTATLSGLSADADLRLIVDRNGNRQLDSADEVVWQWERGNREESVRRLIEPGGYFVEVSSYDGRLTDYTLQTSFQPLGPNEADPLKFDLQVNYGSGSEQLNQTARNAIAEAEAFWERAIPYHDNKRLILDGPLPITIVVKDLPNERTLAATQADPVWGDASRLRLRSGEVSINTRQVARLTSNDMTALLIHEFAHALGFGTLWDPVLFRNGAVVGTRPGGGSWIDKTTLRYQADSYAGWAYGELLRNNGQLSTTAPTAVPIEPQVFQHWSEEVFQTESLTPIATTSGTAAPVSQLTLAAMKDLGWNVNFGVAQSYSLTPNPIVAASSSTSSTTTAASAARSLSPETPTIACGCRLHLGSSGSGLLTVGRDSLASAIGIG